METFLVILFIITCIVMVISILMQSSKGGGLAGSFGGMGGGGSVFSPRGAVSFLQKTTTITGILFILLALLMTKVGTSTGNKNSSVLQEQINKIDQTQAPANLPNAPIESPSNSQNGEQGKTKPDNPKK